MVSNSSSNLVSWTSEELSSYMQAVELFYITDNRVTYCMSVIITSTCIIGFFGYFLELLVLRNPAFRDPGFLYHKILAICEILLLITFPMMSANGFTSLKQQSFLSVYMAKVANPAFSNVLALTIYTLIVGMAFNRYFAITNPVKFKNINVPKYPYAFFIAGLLQGLVGFLFLFIFGVEFNADCSCYKRILTSFFPLLYSPMFITGISLEVINSVANGFLTTRIIWGLLKKSAVLQESQNNEKLVEEKAKMFLLTTLCLSCSVPFFISFLFAAIPYFFPDFVVGSDALLLTYKEANKQLQIAYAYSFYNLAHETWYDLTHSTHFYMYLLLNKRFRDTAKLEISKTLFR